MKSGGIDMGYSFFAMLFRMKYIQRWALMRNTRPENLSEHAMETAAITHCLAVIRNKRFGGSVNPERAALIGLYHDCTEIITGDLPTPVKYHDPALRTSYKQIEREAAKRMVALLPEELQEEYDNILQPNEEDGELWQLCKGADKLTALIKCMEEEKMGNTEFVSAKRATIQALEAMDLPEVEVFMQEYLPAFALALDELG
jgi:5'-deoxynucleotidase